MLAEDASVAVNGDSPLFLICLIGFLEGTLGLCSEVQGQKSTLGPQEGMVTMQREWATGSLEKLKSPSLSSTGCSVGTYPVL